MAQVETKGTYVRKTPNGKGGFKIEIVVPKPKKPQGSRGMRYSA